jgi:hypothetical protein
MPAQIFGAQAAVTYLNRAFANSSPIKSVYDNQVSNANTLLATGSDATQVTSYLQFAKNFGTPYAGQTAAQLSTLLMTNLNLLPNAALETALADYITAAGTGNVGIVALQLAPSWLALRLTQTMAPKPLHGTMKHRKHSFIPQMQPTRPLKLAISLHPSQTKAKPSRSLSVRTAVLHSPVVLATTHTNPTSSTLVAC